MTKTPLAAMWKIDWSSNGCEETNESNEPLSCKLELTVEFLIRMIGDHDQGLFYLVWNEA